MKLPTCSSLAKTPLVLALLLLVPLGPVQAEIQMPPAVDQEIIVVQQAALAISAGWSWGQSFIVGRPGALTRIDFQLGRADATSQPLQVELRRAINDLPDLTPSGLLFSGSIAAADVPVLTFTDTFATSLYLSGAAPVVEPGDKLAVLLSSNDYAWYTWVNSGYFYSNPYPQGTSIKKNSSTGGNWVMEENWDFGFRTWVAPVPEPTGLLPLGLAILALTRRGFRF